MKKITSVIALTLAVSMVTVCSFAAPGKGNNGKNGSKEDKENGRPSFEQKSNNGVGNEKKDMPPSFRSEIDIDFDDISDTIEEKLGSITDSDTKENIKELLDAYETAYNALKQAVDNSSEPESLKELRDACQTARKALKDAVRELKFDIKGEIKDNRRPEKIIGRLNVDDVCEKINALEDSELKTNLLALVDSYSDALSEYKSAVESGDTEDSELDALEEALESAQKSLEDAIKEAEIAPNPSEPNRGDNRRPNNSSKKLDVDSIKEQIDALEDADAKAELEELLKAYIAAFEAEETALSENSTASGDELKELNKAVKDAEKELDNALKKAGVKYSDYKAPNINNKAESTAEEKPENQQNTENNGGFLNGIFNWFGNFFK